MKQLFIFLVLFSFNAFATPVNINTADAKTISKALKGIGQKKAEQIVAYRTKNGAFKTLKDLTLVKGVGEKTVKKNADDILFASTSKKPRK